MTLQLIAADDVISSLPKERQKAIAARGNELLEKLQRRMTLSEIRKGQKISQQQWQGAWHWPDADIAAGET